VSGAGVVHLVGADPGDPLLLTRRAARLLAEADVVVADLHTTEAVAALAPATAERCHVGPDGDEPAWSTERVVELLASRAAAGRRVVRLEEGDVVLAGTAGTELAALRRRGVEVTVTPGVSAATAAPLLSGMVPVPGTTVTLVAGDRPDDLAAVPWQAIAEPGAALVLLVGDEEPDEIADRLTAAGVATSTPATVVRRAGRPGTRTVRTDVGGLPATVVRHPSTIVVGPLRPGVRRR